MKKKNNFLRIFVEVMGVLGVTASAHAVTWSGGSSTDGNWSDTANWVGNVAPVSTDTVLFNTAIANTWGSSSANPVNIDLAEAFKSLTFDTNAGVAFIGTTGGNALTLGSGGIIQIAATAVVPGATETINAPLILSGTTYTFTNANTDASTTLNIGGTVTGGSASATTLSLSGVNTGANTVSGIISNGTAASVAVTKTGTGTWVLSGNNTYTGVTTVNDGTLKLGSVNGISSASAVTVSDTTASGIATLDLNGFNRTFSALPPSPAPAYVLTLGGNAMGGAQVIGSNSTLTLMGNVHYTAVPLGGLIAVDTLDLGGGVRTFEIDNASTFTTALTISSVIQNGTLSKNGKGSLLLTGENTYAGGTTDQGGGILILGNNNALGTGALTIASSGTVQSDSSTARSLNNAVAISSSPISVGPPAVPNTATFAGTGDLSFGALSITGNTTAGPVIAVTNGRTSFTGISAVTPGVGFTKTGSGALLINGDDTTLKSAKLVISGGMFAISGALVANNIDLNGGVFGGNGNYSQVVGASTGGSVQWTASTSGGFAAYGTSANWGDAANNLTVNLGNGTGLTWGSTASFVSSGSSLILGNAASNGTVTFQNAVNLNGASQTVQVDRGASAPAGGVDAVMSGVLSNGGLTKTGAGTLQLSGANTYTGATQVTAGTLLIGHNQALGLNSAVTLAGSTLGFAASGFTTAAGALTLTGNSILSFATGGDILRFASSNGNWASGITLSIYNWNSAVDTLSFGSDNTGLSAAQLSSIDFYSDNGSTFLGDATFIGGGNISFAATPEPETWGLLLGAGGLLLMGSRKARARLSAFRHSVSV